MWLYLLDNAYQKKSMRLYTKLTPPKMMPKLRAVFTVVIFDFPLMICLNLETQDFKV